MKTVGNRYALHHGRRKNNKPAFSDEWAALETFFKSKEMKELQQDCESNRKCSEGYQRVVGGKGQIV